MDLTNVEQFRNISEILIQGVRYIIWETEYAGMLSQSLVSIVNAVSFQQREGMDWRFVLH